jgi:hypothetical protein
LPYPLLSFFHIFILRSVVGSHSVGTTACPPKIYVPDGSVTLLIAVVAVKIKIVNPSSLKSFVDVNINYRWFILCHLYIFLLSVKSGGTESILLY